MMSNPLRIPVYSPTGIVAYYRLPKYVEQTIPPFHIWKFRVDYQCTLSVKRGFGYFYDSDGERVPIQEVRKGCPYDCPYDTATAVPLVYLKAYTDYRIENGVEMRVSIMEV